MTEYLRAQKGDADALSALVRRHMPLVQTLSNRLALHREDAFSAGCVGLVTAIRRYVPSRGAAFSTFAVPHILGEMRRAMGSGVGWRTKQALRKANAARDMYLRAHGREPPLEVLAEASGLDASEIALLLETSKQPLYDGESAAISALPDPRSERWLDRLLLRDLVSRLPQPDRLLLHVRFVQDKSQSESALLLGANQSTVSRRERRICLSLRRELMD